MDDTSLLIWEIFFGSIGAVFLYGKKQKAIILFAFVSLYLSFLILYWTRIFMYYFNCAAIFREKIKQIIAIDYALRKIT